MAASARGDPSKQLALQYLIEAAGDVSARGDLRIQGAGLAQGWVQVFPEPTDYERRLEELPDFTRGRNEQWLETYPIHGLGLTNNTGSFISTPIDPLNLCVKLFGLLGKTGRCSTTEYGLSHLDAWAK